MKTATVRELTGKEQEALAYLDGEGMDAAIERSGLTREQVVEANNLRAAHRRLNGGVSVVDVPLPEVVADPAGAAAEPADAAAVDGPVPVVEPVRTVGELLARADEIGGKRAQYLAARIRADADDLEATLAEDEETWGARQRRAELLAARALLDGQIAQLDATLRPAAARPRLTPTSATKGRSRAKNRGKPRRVPAPRTAQAAANSAYYSAEVRAWAKENGFKVGEHGRMRNDVIAAYLAAQQEPAAGAADES